MREGREESCVLGAGSVVYVCVGRGVSCVRGEGSVVANHTTQCEQEIRGATPPSRDVYGSVSVGPGSE